MAELAALAGTLGFAGIVFDTASKDGRTLFTGGTDNLVRLWDLETGLSTGTFKGHNDDVQALVFSQQGEHWLTLTHGRGNRQSPQWAADAEPPKRTTPTTASIPELNSRFIPRPLSLVGSSVTQFLRDAPTPRRSPLESARKTPTCQMQ